MTIAYACYFGNGRFAAMARVLKASIEKNGGVEAEIEEVAAPSTSKPINSFLANTEKLHHWRDRVHALDDGERLVLLDGDTLVLRPLARAFELFSTPIALTSKGEHIGRMRYNGGVVFLRGGPDARAFIDRWVEVNDWLFADRSAHIPLESRHGGINQAAWGHMRETRDPACALVTDLPCRVWNACYPPLWATAIEDATIVHFKSELRAALWSHGTRYLDLVNLWRSYDERAIA